MAKIEQEQEQILSDLQKRLVEQFKPDEVFSRIKDGRVAEEVIRELYPQLSTELDKVLGNISTLSMLGKLIDGRHAEEEFRILYAKLESMRSFSNEGGQK